ASLGHNFFESSVDNLLLSSSSKFLHVGRVVREFVAELLEKDELLLLLILLVDCRPQPLQLASSLLGDNP
ncbi:MAG: hypothetical protein AAF329_20085, partial [Cyanobacteria bacterium P01_A01_bin.17]